MSDVSVNKLASVEENLDANGYGSNIPKERFHLMKILCLALGLMHFTPVTFFVTSNSYWMYKFRNTTANETETSDASERTSLQAQFFSTNTICSSVATVIFVTIATLYGRRIPFRLRVIGGISLMSLLFVVGTIFVEVNTDDWQLTFFGVILFIIFIINGVNTAVGITLWELLGKLPKIYTKLYLNAEGCAGIIVSLLQIMSLAIGTSVKVSALIYYITGCAILTGTLLIFTITEHTSFYKYYMKKEGKNIPPKQTLSLSEMFEILKAIKWLALTASIALIGMVVVKPSVTSLVVSEFEGVNVWGDIYFVPVVTYLLGDLSDLIGRLVASFIKLEIDDRILFILGTLRIAIFIPLIVFSNAQPRSNLPVIFDRDYQYIIITIFSGFCSGFFFNLTYLSVPKRVAREKADSAYAILTTCFTIALIITSTIGFFVVDLI